MCSTAARWRDLPDGPPDLSDAHLSSRPRHRQPPTDCLSRLSRQATLRRTGCLYPPPDSCPSGPRPPRRGARRPSLPRARRAGTSGRTTQPAALQRPLPDAEAPNLGAQDPMGHRRNRLVQHRQLLRTDGVQHAGLGPPPRSTRGVRSGPRHPVPGLGAPAPSVPRKTPHPVNHPPPHHRGPEVGNPARPDPLGGVR